MLQRVIGLVLLGALGALAGCATVGGNPDDPLEGYNRAMFSFNDSVDRAVIKPVATGYKKVMPQVARTGVTNFFSNLGDIWIGINNVLQGKVGPGVSDFGRFAINTTVGILGLFDVASNAGLDKHNEDFGQTLGRWGVGPGAYVVLPLLGPSDVRDGFSTLVVDWHGDPLWYVNNIPTRNELVATHFVDQRANLLDASRLMEEAALDRYIYVRSAYLQRRRSLVYDGNPPRQPDPGPTSKSSPNGASPAQIAAVSPPEPHRPPPGEPSVAGARPRSYEPVVPRNYNAVLDVSGEASDNLKPTGLRP
jgi:phospholipid-binding lipoprotein MlaA